MPLPREWTRSLIEVLVSPDELAHIRLLRQGEPMRVFAQPLDGVTRVFAEWPLSGTGRYRLTLQHGNESEDVEVTVAPQKISSNAYGAMVEELQTRLPASVAVALQKAGALAGLELRPPRESTLAQELARLRTAVIGGTSGVGLISTLEAIARDPHRVLQKHERWVSRSRVRRLEPVGLVAAIRASNNLDQEPRLPKRVPDVRVEHTVDVYENRLLRSFHDQVAARLRRLGAALDAEGLYVPLVEVEELLARLRRSRHSANFLDDVGRLDQLPTRVTMVLLKRPDYRSMLEGYLRFRRSAFVQLDERALEAPLENLPYLYELWGTLHVILALTTVANELGYVITRQQLAKHLHGGLYLKVLPGGVPALELQRPGSGDVIALVPQRSYTTLGTGLRSISFTQIPDISVEIRRTDRAPQLLLFDPKYKLQSEEAADPGDGKPKKEDIDTMHAYRDAIRDPSGARVVTSAAILYPGSRRHYGHGIEAISAQPLAEGALQKRLREVLAEAITVTVPLPPN
jgi:predicted component of viral defense system (DUF524 family)